MFVLLTHTPREGAAVEETLINTQHVVRVTIRWAGATGRGATVHLSDGTSVLSDESIGTLQRLFGG
jgi:hypothetical protein